MSRHLQHLAIGLLLTAWAVQVSAQSPPPGSPARPTRRPFATSDTPHQTGRIREVDIKHIKAELTLDAKNQELHGTVTHTLTPLHPYLTALTWTAVRS